MPRCPACLVQCVDLGKHYGHSRGCSIASEKAPVRAPPTTVGVEADSQFKMKFARRINLDYANLRYKRFIDTSHLDAFHEHAVSWMDLLFESVLDAVTCATSVSEALRAMRCVFSEGRAVLVKYQSEAMRDAYLIKTLKMPYIEPVPYTEDIDEFRKFAAKLSLREVVGRILQHDPQARKLIKAKSDEWMQGDKHMIKSDVYTDITDGWRCRSHEHLMRKATAAEICENVIRIGIGVHNDDVTFANPIGTKRGEHKDSITDASIINLPLNKRHSFEYILLLSVVNSKTLKERGGVEWSFCGVNEKGQETVKDSLAAEFRACSFSIKLPNDADPTGADISHRVELYFIIFEGDWLAAAAMGYTPESTSATYPCAECMWVSKAARKRGRDVEDEAPRLRTHADLAATAARLTAARLSKVALEEQMAAAGMNALTCVLQPDRIPGADSVRDKPGDIMHVYGAGIIRPEAALALEVLFKPRSALAVEDAWSKLNVNIAKVNAGLPRGKRIPKIFPQRKGKKINEQHLDVNASEAFLFITHSRTLIEPLLTDLGRKHPCWISLQALSAVVQKALQHVFADHEADELAVLIAAHNKAFEDVEEYDGLERPKHHFQEHLPAALRMFGPLRGFWCMPFEAFLQVNPSPCFRHATAPPSLPVMASDYL
jgi:hypothetical protein